MATQEIKGYKYLTENEKEIARAQINRHYGIPANPNSVTTDVINFYINPSPNVFWYAYEGILTTSVFGEGGRFDIDVYEP